MSYGLDWERPLKHQKPDAPMKPFAPILLRLFKLAKEAAVRGDELMEGLEHGKVKKEEVLEFCKEQYKAYLDVLCEAANTVPETWTQG